MPVIVIVLVLFFSSAANDGRPMGTTADSTRNYTCSFMKDGTLIAAGLTCDAAAAFVETSVRPLSAVEIGNLSPQSINRFDRSATKNYSPAMATASDALVAASIAAPFALLTDAGVRKDLVPFCSMYGEVLAFSYALPAFGKGITERIRPFVYNPSAPLRKKQEKDAFTSFFSRHTTYAFASAVFTSTLYAAYNPESLFKPYVWTVTLAGASTVGYLRYKAGVHFPTDILTGAAVGSIIGFGIPWLHKCVKRTHLAIDPFQHAVCLYWTI
jgi:hypothetical protein